MYRAALDRSPATDTAKSFHTMLMVADRAPDAAKFAVVWLKQRPADLDFSHHLGIMAMERGDFAAAETVYARILVAAPDNAVAGNNLAWSMLKQGKSGAAGIAERANAKMPGQLEILETLVQALMAERQWGKAQQWQREIVAKLPDSPDQRLILAKLLLETGDRAQAKVELEKLKAYADKFSKQSEVTDLLARL